MSKIDSSSAKYLPVLSLSNIESQPDLHASIFNKEQQSGFFIGVNESSILFVHQKMTIFPTCTTSISLLKFPLANLSWIILCRSSDM